METRLHELLSLWGSQAQTLRRVSYGSAVVTSCTRICQVVNQLVKLGVVADRKELRRKKSKGTRRRKKKDEDEEDGFIVSGATKLSLSMNIQF